MYLLSFDYLLIISIILSDYKPPAPKDNRDNISVVLQAKKLIGTPLKSLGPLKFFALYGKRRR